MRGSIGANQDELSAHGRVGPARLLFARRLPAATGARALLRLLLRLPRLRLRLRLRLWRCGWRLAFRLRLQLPALLLRCTCRRGVRIGRVAGALVLIARFLPCTQESVTSIADNG